MLIEKYYYWGRKCNYRPFGGTHQPDMHTNVRIERTAMIAGLFKSPAANHTINERHRDYQKLIPSRSEVSCKLLVYPVP
jgi:hypothetical protein